MNTARVLFTSFCLFALATVAHAAEFAVNTDADTVDATPGDGDCADAGGDCSLRAAVMETNALAGPDKINVPAGLFRLTLIGAGEDAAATGDLDIAGQLTLEGAGREDTVIDGLGADRILQFSSANNLTVTDLTMVNGDAAGAVGGGILHPGPGDLTIRNVRMSDMHAVTGGCVVHIDGGLTIENCVFEDAAATTVGGIVKDDGETVLRDTQFTSMTSTGAGAALVFTGATAGDITLENCGFLDCTATGPGGAVVSVSPGTVSVTDCEFEDCRSFADAGAMYVSTAASCTIEDTRFSNNEASANAGASFITIPGDIRLVGVTFDGNTAISNAGALVAVVAAGDITIEDCRFENNQATTAAAGGAYVSATGDFRLLRSVFVDNQASANAGGLGIISVAGECTIEDAEFTDNRSTAGPGGGLVAPGLAGGIEMRRTLIRGNTSGLGGFGGAYLNSAMPIHVEGSTIAENRANGVGANGGGLQLGGGGAAELINCTLSGNIATGLGGALLTTTPTTITHCTFAENAALGPAPVGAHIHNTVAINLENSIFADAVAGDNCTGAAIVSSGHNIDDDGTCAAGATDSSDDPELGPLQDNGGPTPTHALSSTSPALEAAATAACTDADQRGVERPRDGDNDGDADCDIGAFEFFDCDENGTDDTAEIAQGAADCNDNGVLDTCESEDTDADGLADQCDECTDTDGDGLGDPGFAGNTCALDNCPTVANPDQADGNGNGIGDACEAPAGLACCGGASPLALPFMLGGWMWIRRSRRN